MKEAAKYVKKLLQKLALEKVFVATDGTKKGIPTFLFMQNFIIFLTSEACTLYGKGFEMHFD